MKTLQQLTLAALLAALVAAGGALAADTSPPVLNHTAVTKTPPGPLRLTTQITDESKVFPQVFLRTGKSNSYESPIDLKKVKGTKDLYEVTITAKPGLEYYLECYDEYGNGPARSGSPDQPLKVEVEEASAAAPAHPAPAPKPAPAASPTRAPEVVAVVEHREPAPDHAVDRPHEREALRERPLQTSLEGTGPIGADGAFVRSLLLPGFGQFKTSRPVRGGVFATAAAVGVASSVLLAVRANQANDVLNSAPPSLFQDAHDQAWRYTRARNWAIGLTAVLWVVNAGEAYLGYSHD